MRLLGLVTAVIAAVSSSSAIYLPLKEYAGTTFFDAWDYWGNVDNTTWGNVTYLDQTTANAQRLTYVDANGHAIIRVDNTTNIAPATLVNRPSIRLTSKDTYGVGTLWVIDVIHLPYGCSVWPSFWTLGVGKEWPHSGEIDIIEGINLMGNNQMALHADDGCMQAPNPGQSGKTLLSNCTLDQGCIVAETKPNSFGASFANAGGGVFAVQMDVSGVYMWFWSRPDIPPIIATASSTTNMDTVQFGMPSASYPAAGCNITQYFGPQQFILLTTLCGSWAGVPDIYASTCPGNCILSNIVGPGNPTYDNAYWEISYIRTYAAETLAPPASSLPTLAPPAGTTGSFPSGGVTTTTAVDGPQPTSGASTGGDLQNNGGVRIGAAMGLWAVFGVIGLLCII